MCCNQEFIGEYRWLINILGKGLWTRVMFMFGIKLPIFWIYVPSSSKCILSVLVPLRTLVFSVGLLQCYKRDLFIEKIKSKSALCIRL